ncbi:hypothetical protein Nstercoris_01472 [Nitrosomonas stercoris]|uniref:Addiction module toxin, HicA family n=1 Tax=Nitrosomonas stercoris TaxID=1444684 RepID=A0A4Y1YM36_9PROT|nr:hypothetical protein Nstercoris_01472 [Nitrosomonas stercoris]
MPKLPYVSGTQAIRALERLGFSVVRQRGSHVILRRGASGCVVTQSSRAENWHIGRNPQAGRRHGRGICECIALKNITRQTNQRANGGEMDTS